MGYDIVSLIPEFCAAFLGQSEFSEGRIAHRESIPVQEMNYSVESLNYLDQYLDLVHKNKNALHEQDYINTVLAAGCYLGEVIRLNPEKGYAWINYNDYFPHHPRIAALVPEGLGSCAVLANSEGTMTMPINKIIRYIEEGPENNTHFYATGELRPRK
jgi:hypothetical protein